MPRIEHLHCAVWAQLAQDVLRRLRDADMVTRAPSEKYRMLEFQLVLYG